MKRRQYILLGMILLIISAVLLFFNQSGCLAPQTVVIQTEPPQAVAKNPTTLTPSLTQSSSGGEEVSVTPEVATGTATLTQQPTITKTETLISTITTTLTVTPSETIVFYYPPTPINTSTSARPKSTRTATTTPTVTRTGTATQTSTVTATQTVTRTQTVTSTVTRTGTPTQTRTATVTPTTTVTTTATRPPDTSLVLGTSDDGQDCNEIVVAIIVENTGERATAENVIVAITINQGDEYITEITPNELNFGDIAPGASETQYTTLDLNVHWHTALENTRVRVNATVINEDTRPDHTEGRQDAISFYRGTSVCPTP